MPRRDRALLTVSPPTLNRTAFAKLDADLPETHGPFCRDWLMRQFGQGLEIRMLRDPGMGFVAFQPGRLCWRPIEGVERAMVVHDLRLDRVGDVPRTRDLMWDAVERFARYYGYAAILAITGTEAGLIDPGTVPAKRWITLDHGPGEARLVGRILQGPMALPRLPTDWARRATACGPGLVVQTTAESATVNAHIAKLVSGLSQHGLSLRRDVLADPVTARHRAVSPGTLCSVVLDGQRLGGLDMSVADIVQAATRRRPA